MPEVCGNAPEHAVMATMQKSDNARKAISDTYPRNAAKAPAVPFEIAFRIPTPLGYDLAIALHDGAIARACFVRSARKSNARAGDTGHQLIHEVRTQVKAYFTRRLYRFDLPLRPQGTPFAVEVWKCVAGLGFGEFVSYADVARAIGRPLAHRGVALAMARTPIDLFIPAHRVVGADGRVTGAGPGSLRLRLVAFERKGRAARRRKSK
jgi:methylated-DNA-[protein]-cysteine S-methyltransferase